VQAEYPGAGILRQALVRDDPHFQQDPQVLAHGRGAHTEFVGQFARTTRPGGKEFYGAEPGRIGQCAEQKSQKSHIRGPLRHEEIIA
jgi:hypothetical protein